MPLPFPRQFLESKELALQHSQQGWRKDGRDRRGEWWGDPKHLGLRTGTVHPDQGWGLGLPRTEQTCLTLAHQSLEA